MIRIKLMMFSNQYKLSIPIVSDVSNENAETLKTYANKHFTNVCYHCKEYGPDCSLCHLIHNDKFLDFEFIGETTEAKINEHFIKQILSRTLEKNKTDESELTWYGTN